MTQSKALLASLAIAASVTALPAQAGLFDSISNLLSGKSGSSSTQTGGTGSVGTASGGAQAKVNCTGAGSVQEAIQQTYAQRVSQDAPQTSPSQAVQAYGVNDTLSQDLTSAYKSLMGGFDLSNFFTGMARSLLTPGTNNGQQFFAGQVNGILTRAGAQVMPGYAPIVQNTGSGLKLNMNTQAATTAATNNATNAAVSAVGNLFK